MTANIIETRGLTKDFRGFTAVSGVDLQVRTDVEEKIIACDSEKIERIVLNLISNAIKFSDEGDEILVEVKDKNEFRIAYR